MPFTVTMPKLSPTMTEGTIAKWHKKEGDFCEAGELLLEVSTDKATVEHSTLDEGYLRKILVQEGGEAQVNQPIALFTETMEEEVGEVKPATPEKMTAASKPEPVKSKAPSQERVIASPLAKKIASQEGIDLKGIKGSGPGGRIMKQDLKAQAAPKYAGVTEIPMTQMRKVIAKRLQEAKSTIPHFYVSQDVDMEHLIETRKQMEPLKITINDFVLRAASLALKDYPAVNCGFDSARQVILQYDSIDVCFALTLPDGLITPIIKGTDKKGLKEISQEVKTLAKKAKEGKLSLDEFQGGSFTVSNLGMFEVADFSAIINPPQAAILSVSGVRDLAVVKDGKVVPGKILRITLSADHRVVDGVLGAKFVNAVKKYLENPALLTV